MNRNTIPSSAPAMMMRGGTSKGIFFLKEDLPDNIEERNKFLLRMMGSPDIRQIDGVGGGTSLTSKVAIISKSEKKDTDINYLFLQVFVDKAIVTDQQNCGNILAGVAPFALEKGLIEIQDGETSVSIFMENTGKTAISTVSTPNKNVNYQGTTHIDGVPGNAAPIYLEFKEIAGSSCGSLLPTGNIIDRINDIDVTMIDNGMPCLIINAEDVGITGQETKAELDANETLKKCIENIRLKAGNMMKLGDVSEKSVPKITLVSKAVHGGTISTRTFIPHDCHASIGVFGAISVATACALNNSVANKLASIKSPNQTQFSIEHPSGAMECVIQKDGNGNIIKSEIVRTARKLFDGRVFA